MYVCAWGGRSVCLRRHWLCSCKPKSTMMSMVVQSVVWVRIRIKLDTRQYCVCKVHRRVAPTFWHVNHIAWVTHSYKHQAVQQCVSIITQQVAHHVSAYLHAARMCTASPAWMIHSPLHPGTPQTNGLWARCVGMQLTVSC